MESCGEILHLRLCWSFAGFSCQGWGSHGDLPKLHFLCKGKGDLRTNQDLEMRLNHLAQTFTHL